MIDGQLIQKLWMDYTAQCHVNVLTLVASFLALSVQRVELDPTHSPTCRQCQWEALDIDCVLCVCVCVF